MTIKPKTRKVSAKRTAVAQALARHTAAQAAYDARPDGHEDVTDSLWTAEENAFEALAETPCANDAEFIGKLRYMHAHDIRIWGDPDHGDEFGSILVAVDRHFNRAA
jgi:hypothetical protein